jgi:hypothetical protein
LASVANLSMPLKFEELSVMSHHYSGPNFGFPNGDARLDLTVIYAFRSPIRGDASVLVLNAHPSTDLNTLEPTTTDPFAPDAVYELKIDTDGDAVADIAYRVLVSGSQEFDAEGGGRLGGPEACRWCLPAS